MSAREKLVHGAGALWCLLLGLLAPLIPIRKQAYGMSGYITLFFSRAPLLTLTVIIIIAAVSGATMYLLVRVLQHQSDFFLPLFKLFIIGLPAIAVGYVAAIALGWLRLGPYEAAWKGWPFLAVSAVNYLCGGIGGIVAMKSRPRRKQGA